MQVHGRALGERIEIIEVTENRFFEAVAMEVKGLLRILLHFCFKIKDYKW